LHVVLRLATVTVVLLLALPSRAQGRETPDRLSPASSKTNPNDHASTDASSTYVAALASLPAVEFHDSVCDFCPGLTYLGGSRRRLPNVILG
jgi:hypothetical protein